MRIADCGLRIADCGLRIADCGMTETSNPPSPRLRRAGASFAKATVDETEGRQKAEHRSGSATCRHIRCYKHRTYGNWRRGRRQNPDIIGRRLPYVNGCGETYPPGVTALHDGSVGGRVAVDLDV